MNCNKKPKYNLGDEVYCLIRDEHYCICKGKIITISYSELLNMFFYSIKCASFFKTRIEESHIFTNEEDTKKYAYLRFVEMCNDINDVVNGRAKFSSYSTLKNYLERLQDLNKAFGFQLQIYPYKCKKDLKKEIKRLKGE